MHDDTTITLLYVSNLTSGQNRFIAGGSFSEWKETEERRASDLLADARERTEAFEGAVQTEHQFGDPLRTIVEFANEREFDQIVIGNRGRDGFMRFALGSVAERVVREAPMPVVVVKGNQ